MLYPPLEFMARDQEKLNQDMPFKIGNMWKDCYPLIMQAYLGLDDTTSRNVTMNDFKKYILHRGFLCRFEGQESRFQKWNENLVAHVPTMLQGLGYSIRDVQDAIRQPGHVDNIMSDVRDILVESLILDQWCRNKQVLKPDPVFAEHLCATQELDVRKDTFDNLPFQTFYVDLEDCNKDDKYGNIYGVFVDVMHVGDDEAALTLYVLDRRFVTFSCYLNFDLTKCEKIDTSRIERTYSVDIVPIVKKERQGENNDTAVLNSRLITVMVLQLINYLKVAKPDIAPSPEMKTTYRPRTTIKNKYSEIYKQEVGIRIGRTISNNIIAFEKAKKEQAERAVSENRKPPSPHFRCAHWHRYWTGKGRTNCELRWIEPVFVCGSYSSDSKTDVVIHDVK